MVHGRWAKGLFAALRPVPPWQMVHNASTMPTDTIVTSPGVSVRYVAGDPGEPIPVQAPKVVLELEQAVTSMRGKRFFGVILNGEYRACVAIRSNDDDTLQTLPVYVIPGGRYVHRRLPEWEHDTRLIASTVEDLISRSDYDPSRPVIEFYRSHTELVIKVPVK